MTLALALALALQVPSEWNRFDAGSWAETVTTGKRDGAEVRTTERSSLKEITPTEVVISLDTVEAGGGRSSIDIRYPLQQRETKEEAGRKTGSEKLTIDGKTYECDILERGGVRRWVCAAAAANKGVLKTESIVESVQILSRVLRIGEKVKVGKDEVTCWVREEITDTGDQRTTRTTWMSDDVPGGVVKAEVRQVRGSVVVVETLTTLTGFLVVHKK
jgi:hypothetical protein